MPNYFKIGQVIFDKILVEGHTWPQYMTKKTTRKAMALERSSEPLSPGEESNVNHKI